MAVDCQPSQIWSQTGCECGTESPQRFASWDSSLHHLACRSTLRPLLRLRRGQTVYVYGWPAVPRSTSWRRQCRKHPAMAPQATPAAGSSCPHDVRQRVIRWQPVGLSRCTVQRVGVGLRAASRTGNVNNIFIQRAGASPRIKPACRALRVGMLMTGQLLHGESRGAHSAGKIF